MVESFGTTCTSIAVLNPTSTVAVIEQTTACWISETLRRPTVSLGAVPAVLSRKPAHHIC